LIWLGKLDSRRKSGRPRGKPDEANGWCAAVRARSHCHRNYRVSLMGCSPNHDNASWQPHCHRNYRVSFQGCSPNSVTVTPRTGMPR
jgi:hypothetical protein